MDDNFDRVKKLLKKHGYEIYVSIKSDSKGSIKTFLPERKEAPIVGEMEIVYSLDFKNNAIEYTLNSDPGEPIPCRSYAFLETIFADIERMCQFYGYDTSLMGFYKDGKCLDESKFKKAAFPDSKLCKEDKEKKKCLSSILGKCKKLGFTLDEKNEPGYEDVKEEYTIIKEIITGKK